MTTVDLTDPVAVLRQLGALHLEIESLHDLMAECEKRLEVAGREYDDLAPYASVYVNDGAVPIMASCPVLPTVPRRSAVDLVVTVDDSVQVREQRYAGLIESMTPDDVAAIKRVAREEAEITAPDPCRCGNERVRLSDGRVLETTVDQLAADNALRDFAHGFHLPGGTLDRVFNGEEGGPVS